MKECWGGFRSRSGVVRGSGGVGFAGFGFLDLSLKRPYLLISLMVMEEGDEKLELVEEAKVDDGRKLDFQCCAGAKSTRR